jgi:hypothetical protein
MKKRYSLLLMIFSASFTLKGQTVDDALRFSQTEPLGTARFTSMSGAFGALGGDISTASFNPAGLAVFRRSEITITPGFFIGNTSALFRDNLNENSRNNFAFGNIGLIGTTILSEEGGGWISTSYAVGYNRLSNFNNQFIFSGTNRESSLLDVFTDQANRGNFDAFGSDLAIRGNLIFFDSLANRYVSDIPQGGQGINQRRSLATSGGMGETFFSFAGNYDNRVYLGATLGIANIRFNSVSNHFEQTLPDTANILNNYTYIEEYSTRGNGFNLKLGALFRVNDWFRVGAAIHTPTYFGLNDTYSSRINSQFKVPFTDLNQDVSSGGNFRYNLSTPFRASTSLGFIIAKQALIGIDYQYSDFSSARFGGNDPGFIQSQNAQISSNLAATHNIRLGGEYRFDPFALRAGYSHTTNPYADNINRGDINSFSLGFGIREDFYFIDLAFARSMVSNNRYFMYSPEYIEPAIINFSKNTILATFGLRF